MAWIYFNLGDLKTSRSYLAETQDLNQSVGARAEAGMISGLLCTVLARRGD